MMATRPGADDRPQRSWLDSSGEPPAAQRVALGALRLGLLLQSLGLLLIALGGGSAIGSLLFFWGAPASTAYGLVDPGLAIVTLAAALVASRSHHPAPLLVCALHTLLIAGATTYLGGSFGHAFALPAHGLRYLAPIALLLALRHESGLRLPLAENTLRLACALTFATHGLEAWLGHPVFVDYIFAANDSFLGLDLQEAQVRRLLRLIAIVDLGCALAILARRWRSMAAYMALWGLLTALARVVMLGELNLQETLLRGLNACGPLALYLLWSLPDAPAKQAEQDQDEAARAGNADDKNDPGEDDLLRQEPDEELPAQPS